MIKKILVVAPFPPPVHGHALASRMAVQVLEKAGNMVDVIDSAMDKNFSGNKQKSLFSSDRLFKIAKVLYNDMCKMLVSRYDVVYMSVGISFRGFMRYSPYMLSAIIKNTPYVIHTHGATFAQMYSDEGFLQKRILNFFVSKAAKVIVLGNSLKWQFENFSDNVEVCENAVEDMFRACDAEMSLKTEQRDCGILKLLFLSNIMEAKGIRELMSAFEILDGAKLYIAGEIEPNGDLSRCFYSFLQKNKEKVTYLGLVEGKEKLELLLDSDILILPSKNEGQPISILEAYSCGCAVVTDMSVGGIKDIFKDGTNGESCDHNSPVSIATAIIRCQDSLDRYATNNHKASGKYTLDAFGIRLNKIMEGVY